MFTPARYHPIFLVCCVLITGTIVSCALSNPTENQAVTDAGTLADEPFADEEYAGDAACRLCHRVLYSKMQLTKHGQEADERTSFAAAGCEACHGPAKQHVMKMGVTDVPGLVRFGIEAGSEQTIQNAQCLQCHQSGRQMHWQGSIHDSEEITCSACHVVHTRDTILRRDAQAEVCYRCHQKIRAQTYLVSHHPLREQKMTCSQCHNVHGSAGPSELNDFSLNETCYECHAETRGPFLWEHFPVSEDCSLCHLPHGSTNPSLLIRRPPQLCQQCHQAIRPRHVSRPVGFRFAEFGEEGGPRSSRFVLGGSCLNCHPQVHGSNHPSGEQLMR